MISIQIPPQDAPAIERVLLELKKAREKHPAPYNEMSYHEQGSYLTEEFLEAIQNINDRQFELAKIEISQVAAVCVRILSGN